MSHRLHFDFAPSTANVGEEFTVAVILVDEEGNPADGVEDITAEVSLTTLDEGIVLEGAEPVPLSFGEAMFDAVKIVQAPADLPSGMSAFVATCEGFEPVESEMFDVAGAGGDGNAGGAEEDEDLLDLTRLAQRLDTAKGAKVKHYLMLIKGRLWAKEQNAVEITTCRLMETVVRILNNCDTDEAIECVAVVQEFLTNPVGQVLHSCASCRSTIRVAEANHNTSGQTSTVYSTSTGIIFHGGCLACTKCRDTLGEQPFVRDERLKPWHAKCAEANGITVIDKVPMQCSVVPAPAPITDESVLAPSVEAFLGGEGNGGGSADAFAMALHKNHMKDEYVVQRVQRMMARLPPVIVRRSLSIKALA